MRCRSGPTGPPPPPPPPVWGLVAGEVGSKQDLRITTGEGKANPATDVAGISDMPGWARDCMKRSVRARKTLQLMTRLPRWGWAAPLVTPPTGEWSHSHPVPCQGESKLPTCSTGDNLNTNNSRLHVPRLGGIVPPTRQLGHSAQAAQEAGR